MASGAQAWAGCYDETRVILPLIWVVCALAAYFYSLQQHIPLATAAAAFPAFLLEVTFFYVLGSERLRARIEKLPPATVALMLVAAAVAPYCAASLALGSFRLSPLLWIAGLAAIASFWYVLLPHTPPADLLFLALMALVVLAKLFSRFYISPHPKLPLETLGQLMWIRTGAFALLSVRRVRGVGFGFWPERREWGIGALYYLLFAPVAAALAWAIGFSRPHAPALDWQRASLVAVGTFFGILWVVALGEEFFFRGLLQQWMTKWLSSEWAALLATSLLFGGVHLWFRTFPNWRFAALASVAGVFYGLAFRQARSIRASMVAHALTVTTWRMFFS
jgi:membrane protease YdiL (CAAX protease family)